MQIGLLLLAVALLAFLIVRRKKAEQGAPARPKPAPVAAMEAAAPSQQYGPSVDEVEPEPIVEVEPEPTVEVEAELTVTLEPEPFVVPEVVAEPEPVVEITTEPAADVAPEPISLTHEAEPVAIEPEPDPVAPEFEPESVSIEPAPEPIAPEPEPEPGPVIEPGPEPDRVLEISYPSIDEAPPGLSVDAFKDIKPVAFGGIAVEETAPAEPAPEIQPEPEPEPIVDVHPEPIVEAEPVRDFEPLTYPGIEDVAPVEPEVEAEPEPEAEPEAEMVAATSEPVVEEAKPKKRGFRIPNPELKLPSFGKKKTKAEPAAKAEPTAKAEPAAKAEPKSKGGLKLPQITLPANLQGPLTDVERKVALGCVLAIVAAGALGYKTAPSDDAGTPAPTPAPAAASR
jgi:hypothetical protein